MQGLFERLAGWAGQHSSLVDTFRWARKRWQRIGRRAYVFLCRHCPALVRFYFVLSLRPSPGSREDVLDRYSKEHDNFVFLQIGANDGFSADPIHAFVKRDRWSGVLIEPQPMVFQVLQQVYANHPNLDFVNAALDRQRGLRALYGISVSDARWANGLASFDKETLLEHIRSGYVAERLRMENQPVPARLEDYIVETEVETVPFEDVLTAYDLKRVDLLQIDAEGFDAELLGMFPFEEVLPAFINFEHLHLQQEEYHRIAGVLVDHGYDCTQQGNDTFCVRLSC